MRTVSESQVRRDRSPILSVRISFRDFFPSVRSERDEWAKGPRGREGRNFVSSLNSEDPAALDPRFEGHHFE